MKKLMILLMAALPMLAMAQKSLDVKTDSAGQLSTKIAEDKVAFLCEVNQAALVHIENLQDQQLGHALNATVPSILFPYARENISSLVSKAGFPPFILQPLNFDAIYMQRLQQEAQAAQEAPKAAE